MITMKFDDAKLKINGMQELGIRQAYTDDMPLAEATGFEPGGLHRFDIAVSGYFTKAIDGIMFKRDFRLELRGANGTGALQIEVVAVTHALQQLQGTAREEFVDYLHEVIGLLDTQVGDITRRRDTLANARATLAEIMS